MYKKKRIARKILGTELAAENIPQFVVTELAAVPYNSSIITKIPSRGDLDT